MISTVHNWPVNWQVTTVKETGSTNTDLFQQAIVGAAHRSALVAEYQTAGRGRLDRSWEAVAGANLLVSLLFRSSELDLKLWPRVVGLAAVRACQSFISSTESKKLLSLKWPNDLLLDQVKCGGMLSVSDSNHGFIVVGIGINIGWAPPQAAALKSVFDDVDISPKNLLSALLLQVDLVSELTQEQLHQQYVYALSTLGRAVRVELTNGTTITGQAVDLDNTGRLVVIDEQSEKTVAIETGDVVHLRDVIHD